MSQNEQQTGRPPSVLSYLPPNYDGSSDDPLPRWFGKYLLFAKIGKGGMASIYLGRTETELGITRLVVVKQILPEVAALPGFEDLFINEAKLAANLRHGNITQVFDLGREASTLYMAMEYVEGYDLQQLLRFLTKAKVPLPVEYSVLIVSETLTALDYAHRAALPDGRPMGIVHRDVSPSNVLVSVEGEVKLCDFGIAKATEIVIESRQTPVVGKSAYMSPEHALGGAVTARSDVYCAGILLWELCAGRRMNRGTEEEMLARARTGSAPSLPSDVPHAALFQPLLDRAMAFKPEDRFQSAAEFREALADLSATVGFLPSQLRFANFLSDHFGDQLVAERRSRQKAVERIERSHPTGTTGESDVTVVSERPKPEPVLTPAPKGPVRWVAFGVGIITLAVIAWFALGR